MRTAVRFLRIVALRAAAGAPLLFGGAALSFDGAPLTFDIE